MKQRISREWQYVIDRLKEVSTWRGIILIITAFGVTLSPEQAESIIAAGIALVGMFGVLRKEKK